MKGYFKITKKAVIFLSVAVIAVFIGYTAIYFSNPSRSGKGIEAFLFKIKNAPIEAFKTRVNSNDWKDFNDNYRSYENIVTIRQVSSQGIFAILFGEGMGSRINLGRQIMTTDGTKVQYIPILHNGFATVFLKSGLFGIFFLVLFLFLLAKHNKSDIPEVKSINLLLVGTSIFLIVSNWVFMGLYLKLDNKSVLIGLLVCCRELLIKQKLVQGND
ncbi:MAG TPA: hypothetical protein VFR70_00570 [Flavobacterium sp.]|nr:hypothetical protein [Flavobacterium sp.]